MAKILAFPGNAPIRGSAQSRKKKTDPNLPDWVEHVQLSPWLRLADFLIRETAASPIKLGSAGDVPSSILRDAEGLVAEQTLASGQIRSVADQLDEVRTLLEDIGLLLSNRRSLVLEKSALIMLEQPWRLWGALQSRAVREQVWPDRRQSGGGAFLQSTLSSSLGFLRAVCEDGPVPASRALDLLEPCLEFRDRLAKIGRPLAEPKPRFGPAALNGRTLMPWEEDWFELVVERFALPLGLATLSPAPGQASDSAWNERRPYEQLQLSATALLAAL